MAGPNGRYGDSDDPDIINLSFSDNSTDDEIDALYESVYDAGIVIVAAGGNDGDGNILTDEKVVIFLSERIFDYYLEHPSSDDEMEELTLPRIEPDKNNIYWIKRIYYELESDFPSLDLT